MAERDNVSITAPIGTFESGAAATGYARERSSDQIRQNIAATRDSITETVDELSSRVQRTFDWKTYVADYPLAATGVAVGVGCLVGLFIKSRPTPGERIHDAVADLVEDAADRLQGQFEHLGTQRQGVRQTLQGMVMAALLKAGTDYARDRFMPHNRLESHRGPDSDYLDEYDEATAYRNDPRHSLGY